MGLSASSPPSFLTVQQAAKRLGVKPWDVMRLVQTGEVESVVLIEAASLEAMKEQS